MSEAVCSQVRSICDSIESPRERLLDLLHAVQDARGAVSPTDAAEIAACCGLETERVEAAASFFTAFTRTPAGALRIQIADDPISRMLGSIEVCTAVRDELAHLGPASPGVVEPSPTLGSSDQGPTLRIGGVTMPQVSTADARHALRELAQHRDPRRLIRQLGDGANAHPLVQSALRNNIRLAGRNILRPLNRGAGLRRALAMSPAELIRTVKTARLRGRGLDALPSGIRWSLARSALVERVERQWGAELESCRDYAREFERFDQQEHRCVICNACDAEPGLFRARVLMTERADRVFAGMTMVGYAIGAVQGIVYLGDELAYLRPYLEHLLQRRREDGLLGEDILGRRDVRFDIRILLGSPPYCLGEETAVINACEGRPSVPRSRPPYPTHEGYFGWPTVVHGPETLCCVATIVEVGAPSFVEEGTRDSTGSRLLCISGDCRCPGLYELPMGVGLGTVLDLAGAEGASAVFMSGSRPRYLSRAQLDGHIAFDDLATSGSVVVVGPARDPVRVWCDLAGHYLDATSAFTGCGDERRMLRDLIPAVGERRATPADITRVEEAARRIAEDTPSGFGRSAGWLILGGVRNLRRQLGRCAPGEEPDRRRAGRAR